MKKNISIIIILLTLIACKDSDNNFSIDTTIKGIPDGRRVILKKQVDRKIINIDTAYVKNEKFSFKGEIKEPLILGIFVDSIRRGGIFPFVDLNNHLTIIAYKDSLVTSKISGSKINDELTSLRKRKDDITKRTKALLPEYKKANEANDTITMNKINKEVKKLRDLMDSRDWIYVKNNPDSYVTPMIFTGLMANPNYKDSIKIVFNGLSDKIKNSALSKPIKDYLEYLDKQNTAKPEIKKNVEKMGVVEKK